MRNHEKERIEAKLKLWDTPGFSQFLQDLALYKDDSTIPGFAAVLKNLYVARLKEIEEGESKFKQGKLEL